MAEQPQPYSEKVMDHFQNPRNVGEIPDASGIGTVGNPVCVSPETLILANANAEEIKDISEGARVLSHDGNYHRIEALYCRPYKGLAYRITINNLGSVSTTPDHHILALKLGGRDKFKFYKRFKPDWYCAQELKKGDVVLYPIPRLEKVVDEIDFDIEKPKCDFKSKPLPKKIKVDNDFCRLAGYYLAEGYVRTDKCKGTIGFAFNSQEETYIKDVTNIMKKIFCVKPAELIYNRKKTAADVAFYSARLARFFENQFGKGAANKHLPHWMTELPLEKQRALLCGLWRGDGYIDLKRQRAKYVTISRQLAYQLRLLLLRQNIISNFSVGKPYGIHKESYLCYIQEDDSLRNIIKIVGLNLAIKPKNLNRHKSWIDKKFYYTTVKENKPIEYSGSVYNLEVEDAHSYVSNALTLHNCGDVMKMYLKIENNIITDAKFKTFGCGAAISTSSMVTEMVKGKTIEEALSISNKAVAEALGGLPPVKMHCSVLAEEALRSALADYYKKQGKEPPFDMKSHAHDEHGH